MDRIERARQLRRAVGFGSAALPDEQAAQVETAMQDYLDGKLEIPTLY